MTPVTKRPRLIHVPVRLRVSVRPDDWGGQPRKAIEEDVRKAVAAHVARMSGVVDARRDRL